jgi:hypothetical protein
MRVICTWVIVVAAALTGLVTAANGSASAALIQLNPTADALVTSSNPTGNFGGAGAISVATAGLPNGEFQSFIMFDLSAAKSSLDTQYGVGQWILQSASLHLTAANPGNPLFNASHAGQFAVDWMQDDSWTEGTGNPSSPASTGITYATKNGFLVLSTQSLGTFSFGGGTSGQNAYDLLLASGFTSDVATGGNLSLHLYAADSAISYLFNSRSFGTTTSRPILSLTAVATPEPATLALLACGSLLLVRGRRRLAV